MWNGFSPRCVLLTDDLGFIRSVTKISRFVFFQDMLQNWCNMLFDSFSNLIKSSGASAKVFEMLNRRPEYVKIPGRGQGEQAMAAMGGHIAFDNVHFSYPGRPDDVVLRGVTFEAEAGKTLAIIGKSGSGKSTIINLIENFYRPSLGRVLLDGREVGSLAHARLHSLVSIVNQDTVLFSGTIYDNIVYSVQNKLRAGGEDGEGKAERGGAAENAVSMMPEVVAAARTANIHDFIIGLPLGYGTEVGERGVQLSGGQRQRIAIARAILANPLVLLLDEATSALDNDSERAVKDALDLRMVGKTVVVVAHRLSTILNANSILVVEGGEVVDQGPPSAMEERLKGRASEMEIVE